MSILEMLSGPETSILVYCGAGPALDELQHRAQPRGLRVPAVPQGCVQDRDCAACQTQRSACPRGLRGEAWGEEPPAGQGLTGLLPGEGGSQFTVPHGTTRGLYCSRNRARLICFTVGFPSSLVLDSTPLSQQK